jgi:hypothetical protein
MIYTLTRALLAISGPVGRAERYTLWPNVTQFTLRAALTFRHKGKQSGTCDVVNAQQPGVPAQ